MLHAAKEQLEAQRRQEAQVKSEVQDARATLHDASREESRATCDVENVRRRFHDYAKLKCPHFSEKAL